MLEKAAIRFLWDAFFPLISDRTISSLGRHWFARSWRDFQNAAKNPAKYQKKRLLQILSRNAETEFGKRHGFFSVKNPADYKNAVPARVWTDFEPMMSRIVQGEKNVLTSEDIIFFARTSGTTGSPKFIPVTGSYQEEYLAGRKIWLRQVVFEHPGIVRGKLLTIHAPSIDTKSPSGVPCGSITSFLSSINQGSRVARGIQAIPPEVYNLSDFAAKYYYILRFALESPISSISAVNPSTILLFCRKLSEFALHLAEDLRGGTINDNFDVPADFRLKMGRGLKPRPAIADRLTESLSRHGFIKPGEIWKTLCLLCSWKGGSSSFYLDKFPRYFDGLKVMDFGYGATEGNFSVPLSADDSDGILIPHGHYLEFIPESEKTRGGEAALPMDTLEPGGRYYVLITGSNGLYRYDINDLVECTGFYGKTPRVVFVGKGENVLSITGEKITEWQVEEAVKVSSNALGIGIVGFTCSIRLEPTPFYVLAIETEMAFPEQPLRDLLKRFDQTVRHLNLEYEAKRKSLRLEAPLLKVLRPGTFLRFREEQVAAGIPDSQCKPPHISTVGILVDPKMALSEVHLRE